MSAPRATRRRFLLAAATLGGGLLLGYGLRDRDRLRPAAGLSAAGQGGEIALNGWIRIDIDGTVTVNVPNQEMGQGITTSLSMLAAEELDADWSRVRAAQAPLDKIYGNHVLLGDGLPGDVDGTGAMAATLRWVGFKLGESVGFLMTGGSSSVRAGWEPMRLAGASARAMLVAAAAQRWNVPAAECSTAGGEVLHAASGRRAGYGELAAQAARMEPPSRPPLKTQAQYRLIGQPLPRLDLPAKVDGSAVFGIDVRLPGMLYAAVSQCPEIGGGVAGYDPGSVAGMPGFRAAVAIPNGVAVVADSYWRAQSALRQLAVAWRSGPHASLATASIERQFAAALQDGSSSRAHSEGDAPAVLSSSVRTAEARYRVPFLAHATMEPMNCTALVRDGHCEIWVPNQSPSIMRMVAARVAGIATERVTVHSTLLGGGFGRRAEFDFVVQAVTVAMALPGIPVKLLWSREEDMQHDMYRPAAQAVLRACLDADGLPLAWHNRIAGPSVMQSMVARLLPWAASEHLPDKTSAEGSAELPYAMPHQRIEHVLSNTPVPVGFWRSVGHSYNAFFTECFLDELAYMAGQDPYQYRRRLLAAAPRHLRVLDFAASRAGWQSKPGPGRARGIALHACYGSVVAQVAEVSVAADGTVNVHRVVCAIDCGLAVHPDTVAAQMEGAVIFGLTAALYGEITLAGGRVEQSSFPSYEMLRLAQTPLIETYLVNSGAAPGGVGEAGTPPIAPAVANAVFAATGQRLRQLPLRLSPAPKRAEG